MLGRLRRLAVGRVRSEAAQAAQLGLGSDDGCKVWHNGRLVLAVAETRGVEPD